MPRATRHRAFTLIETIAAIVILSVALPPIMMALHAAHHQRVDPALTSTARWLAVEKIEEIIADRHSTTRGYAWITLANYPAESPVAGFPMYSRTVSLAETGPDLVTPGSGYMNVDVTVTWVDSSGTSRSLTVSTVVSDYDL